MIVKKDFVLMHIPAECFQKRYFLSNCLRHCKLKQCPNLSDSTKISVKFGLSSSHRRVRIPVCEYACYFWKDFSRSTGIFMSFCSSTSLYFSLMFWLIFSQFLLLMYCLICHLYCLYSTTCFLSLFHYFSLLSFSSQRLFLFFFSYLLSNSLV